MSRREIQDPDDDLVDQVVAGSVALINSTIHKVEKESHVYDREDWFKRPFDVCELLADRLSCAEWCLKEDVSFDGYLAILDYMDIRSSDGEGWP